MDDSLKALMAEAAYAPFAGFVVVAGADGQVQENEARAFLSSLKRVEDPLLVEMIRSAPEPIEARVDTLVAKTERIASSLAAAGELFARHPRGPTARLAFMAVLRDVAAAHGEVRDTEQRTLDRIEALLDLPAEQEQLQVGLAIQGGLAIFGAVTLWQVLAAALSLSAWFVPVAIGLQLMVMTMLAWVGQVLGHRYAQQVAAGTIASVVGGVMIAVSSMVITRLMFPPASAGSSALSASLAGLLGTVVTGVVLAAILALFFRRR